MRSNAAWWVAEIRIRIESNAGLRRTQIIEHSLAPGLAVIFQHVVPLPRPYERRRRRSGAKVQIGCNDLQGGDLSRRLMHGSVPELGLIGPVSMGTTS